MCMVHVSIFPATLRGMVKSIDKAIFEYATRMQASLAAGIRRDRGDEETHTLHRPALKLIAVSCRMLLSMLPAVLKG